MMYIVERVEEKKNSELVNQTHHHLKYEKMASDSRASFDGSVIVNFSPSKTGFPNNL